MAVRIDLTFDCADPTALAGFWKLALGYEDEPPPPTGFRRIRTRRLKNQSGGGSGVHGGSTRGTDGEYSVGAPGVECFS